MNEKKLRISVQCKARGSEKVFLLSKAKCYIRIKSKSKMKSEETPPKYITPVQEEDMMMCVGGKG
jgi:hypothetical protein